MNKCEFCEKDAVVGVGQKPTWVCELHYEEYLAGMRRPCSNG